MQEAERGRRGPTCALVSPAARRPEVWARGAGRKARGAAATSLSRGYLRETTGIAAQCARSTTARFAGLLWSFAAGSRVPENRGVPSSSLGLAISQDACTWAGFGAADEAVPEGAGRAVLCATSFSRPKLE